MSSYDPRQMAKDALVLATPPAHSGIKSFISEEGVIALATALEANLASQDEIDRLTEELDDAKTNHADEISDLSEELEEAQAKIKDMQNAAREILA